jgi:hypothetical protein
MKNKIPGFRYVVAQCVTNSFASVMEQAEPANADPSPTGSRLNYHAMFTHSYGSAFLQPAAVDGMRRVLLIVDFSGSMKGMWETGGAEFVWGLMQFARQGGCYLRVLLTGDADGSCELPVDTPFDIFSSLVPYASQESFARTMETPVITELMEDADITVCWTDGQLTDGYVDAIRWRERNINVVGACLGHPEMHAYHPTKARIKLWEAMQEYFHAYFISDHPAKVATLLSTWVASCPIRSLQ